jgi:hypothetical protein
VIVRLKLKPEAIWGMFDSARNVERCFLEDSRSGKDFAAPQAEKAG